MAAGLLSLLFQDSQVASATFRPIPGKLRKSKSCQPEWLVFVSGTTMNDQETFSAEELISSPEKFSTLDPPVRYGVAGDPVAHSKSPRSFSISCAWMLMSVAGPMKRPEISGW